MSAASHEAPQSRWRRQHGYGEGSPDGRARRGGKVRYRNFWAAGVVCAELNRWRENSGERPLEPYPCRWGDHWAHGETAEEHWHLGRSRECDRLL